MAENDDQPDHHGEDDTTADYPTDFIDPPRGGDAVRRISTIVGDFQAFAKSVKKSTQAREELAHCLGVGAPSLSIILEVRTR